MKANKNIVYLLFAFAYSRREMFLISKANPMPLTTLIAAKNLMFSDGIKGFTTGPTGR
jgi:hypothetical protein